MNNKNKVKNIFLSIIAMIWGAITVLAAFFGGKALTTESSTELFQILSNIFTGLTFVILAINIIYGIITKSKLQKMRVAEVNEMMLQRKQSINDNFKLATSRLRRTAIFCKIYVAFITVFMHATALFIGASSDTFPRMVLLIIFMTGGVYIRLFGAIIDKPIINPKDFLPKDEFAELYSVAEEAMKHAGVEGKIFISTDNSLNAAISKQGNIHLLLLGAIMIGSLSREELFNVLLHEFAHHSPKYTPKSTYGFFNRFIEHETDGSTITDIIISLPMMKYGMEFSLYTLLSSEYIEAMADKITRDHGDPKSFASAIAKCNFYDMYGKVLYKYQSTPLFEHETPAENIATLNLESFKASVRENKEKWLAILEKGIQPRNASHPIYRLRRDAVGVCAEDVNISFDFEGDSLEGERKKIFEHVNKEIAESLKQDYDELRKANYLAPLEIIDKWQKSEVKYSSAELIPVIDALAGLLRNDEAEALCDKIIAEETNAFATAYPKFFKGYMLLLRDDDTGIDILYEAIELNSNLFEMSIELIGEYVCSHGMQKELDEYRQKATLLAQKQIDEDDKANVLTTTDKIIADDMDETTLKAHIDFITSVSDRIHAVYLVRKVISETFYSRVFLIEFEKETPPEKIDEAMNKIFRYLDTLDDEQYSLFLYGKQYKSIVSKVKGSLKYVKI